MLDTILKNKRDDGARIIIYETAPRHGKSEFFSKYIPAWYVSRWPDERAIIVSYEATFAKSWGRKSRQVFEENCGDFGLSLSSEAAAANEWGIEGHTGGVSTASIGGPLTGKGAHLLVIDDPIKNAEEALSPNLRLKHWDWWQSTASTRLEPGATVLVPATRWHGEDLSGKLIEAAKEVDGPEIIRIRLPAIAEQDDMLGRNVGEALWPERWPLERLLQKRNEMDPFWWDSIYQQNPGGDRFSEWPSEYFEDIYFDRWPHENELRGKAIAIDPSMGQTEKSDYSAIALVALGVDGKYYVDIDLARRPYPKLVDDGLRYAHEFRPLAVGCEVNQFQELLKDEFERIDQQRGGQTWFCGIHNHIAKIVRIRTLTPLLSQRRIKFKRDSASVKTLIAQMQGFPNSQHDDGPDAIEMGIRLLNELLAGSVVDVGGIPSGYKV